MDEQTSRGSLIVIDGVDGSGKATQTELLVEKLDEEGYPTKTIDFPRYEKNLHGKLIGECLDGQHGEFTKLDPKIVSVLYAGDRFESAPAIKKWLADGNTVVVDRYVSSNQMHQGGKIDGRDKKRDFLRWLDRLEYDVFAIPRPDIIFYLDVPAPKTRQLLEQNSGNLAEEKPYTKRRTDTAETDQTYTKDSQSAAEQYLKERQKWNRIECTQDGELLSKKKVHEKLYGRVIEFLNQ